MPKFISSENLKDAVNLLELGALVAFPTDTVYGLGGNAYSDTAVAKIFETKNRPELNPLSVCYASFDRALADVETNDLAEKIAKEFLPGGITLVLKRKKSSKLSLLCSAGLDTIGIRVPSNETALRLLSSLDFPLAAPSANSSGNLSHTTPQEVAADLSNIHILDGGQCNRGIESTIIDCSDEKPKILRYGAVSIEEISEKCRIPVKNIEVSAKSKQFFIHKDIVLNATIADPNDALLAFGKPIENNCKYLLNLSESSDINEAAANFFSMLSKLDQTNSERICVMPIPSIGIGEAINQKLLSLTKKA